MMLLIAQTSSGIAGLTQFIATLIYLALFLIAIWGAYCVIMVWLRVAQKRFRDEDEQEEFMERIEAFLAHRDFASASAELEGDMRAMPQLAHLGIENRSLGYARVKQLLIDRFQRDMLGDFEHRLSWVQTVIKAAPMVGLLGTVVGMMGAFAKLAGQESVKTEALAADISVALITTACGLAIAIPLVLCTASINVRIRKMEDLVATGLTRFLDAFRRSLGGPS
ncbi:MAG: MotA/TolQ/ExbB proton channel family protein [Planctomycetota bacterium]